jgi:hypothetical protein
MLRFFIFSVFILALTACATPAKQTEALLKQRPSVPAVSKIENVPFVQQTAGYCGPATLTMALNWAGDKSSIDQVAPQVYTPGMKGSLQTDLISASRRHGMMAIPIEGYDALLKEVAAGHPVIVFENLALSWYPQWHYAIVFGYDLPKQTVLMHSGPEAFKVWDMSHFERSWMLGDYWGLVVLPPDHLSASAGELPHTQSAAALEQLGKKQEAQVAYSKILERWPKSLPALIGMGNLAFEKKNFTQAVYYLHKATAAHPDSAPAWHNQALAEGAAKNLKEAHRSAVKAVELASAETKSQYKENLKEWY